jgi:CDP-diacylglycerol---glycerol-3-phosphate 3-phosphatidyltransferase
VRILIVPCLAIRFNTLSDRAILALYVLAFATDYLDGTTARLLKTATPALRKADSFADVVFHLAAARLIFHRYPQELHSNLGPLCLFLATSAIWYTLDAVRWRRLAGFHAWSAKLFSIGLLVWVILLLGHHTTAGVLAFVLIFGAVSNIEGIMISLLLPDDCTDVSTVFHALAKRRAIVSRQIESGDDAECELVVAFTNK